jgi:peptidylprolyl isomerase
VLRRWNGASAAGGGQARRRIGSSRVPRSADRPPPEEPPSGSGWVFHLAFAGSIGALGLLAYSMLDEDVRGRRGIFRADNITPDAADAAAMASQDGGQGDPEWKRSLRRAASLFAQERTGLSPVVEPARRSNNPRVFLEFASSDPSVKLPSPSRVVIELRADVVPRTAENFRKLCTGEAGSITLVDQKTAVSKQYPLHFVGSPVHRIIPGFMIQSGDITRQDGTGGWSTFGRRFDDENFEVLHGAAGAVAMANAGPGTNSSQFYITLERAPWLDGRHVVFGRVVEGMDVVKAVGELGSEAGQPTAVVLIQSSGQMSPTDDTAEPLSNRT